MALSPCLISRIRSTSQQCSRKVKPTCISAEFPWSWPPVLRGCQLRGQLRGHPNARRKPLSARLCFGMAVVCRTGLNSLRNTGCGAEQPPWLLWDSAGLSQPPRVVWQFAALPLAHSLCVQRQAAPSRARASQGQPSRAPLCPSDSPSPGLTWVRVAGTRAGLSLPCHPERLL